MVFSSILFLCFFLPAVLLAYFLIPRRVRNLLLLLASLLFYAWGEPKYVLLMLFSTVFDYGNGLLIERWQDRAGRKRAVLILSLAVNLGLLGFFKYTDFLLENWNRLTGSAVGLLQLSLPIGISFYTFQTLSYTIDVYRGEVQAQHKLIDFGTYVCLFPQLVAGPIVRYADVQEQLRDRRETIALFWQGLLRFLLGLGKKVVFANQISALWTELSAANGVLPAGTAWLGALAYTFQIYFDFSGYSDMAIGMGKMLGFTFPENFRYPYEADSITEFWRRWHITLSTWFREYLYIPLGGNRRGKARQLLNLLIVWLLTGLWHGAGWNFILWGFYYFLMLAMEKLFLLRWLAHWPRWLRHIYALLGIVLGWVLFACEDFGVLGQYLLSLFGANGWAEPMTLYYLRSWGALLALLALASTHLFRWAAERLSLRLAKVPRLWTLLQGFAALAVLGISLTLLVGDSYNPFLYFRF